MLNDASVETTNSYTPLVAVVVQLSVGLNETLDALFDGADNVGAESEELLITRFRVTTESQPAALVKVYVAVLLLAVYVFPSIQV